MNKSLYRKINCPKYYFKLSILMLFLLINSPTNAEEVLEPVKSEEIIKNESINTIRTELKKVYQLDFSNSDVILNPRVINFPTTQFISGYGKVINNNSNMIKSAAIADLTKNYLGFTEGWSYSIKENELVIKSSNNINFDKTDIKEKSLSDNVFSVTKKFTITTDKSQKKKEDLPYLISIGEAEIKNGDILEAYNQAKNIAINKGLKFYYKNDLKTPKSGKIYLQNILYNSLDNENLSNLNSYSYIVQFSIQDKK